MTNKNRKLATRADIVSTSRGLLRAYLYLLRKPTRLASKREFAEALKLEGRALGGTLAGNSKVKWVPIMKRAGIDRKGEQVWQVNKVLSEEYISWLRKLLLELNLDVAFKDGKVEENYYKWVKQNDK